MSLSIAMVLAFWYVIWPFTPNLVMKQSPWISPMVRSFAKISGECIADDVDWKIGQARMAELARTRTGELETVLIDCLRSGNSNLRITALGLVGYVAERRQIDQDLCTEIVRAFNDYHSPEVRSEASCNVRFLPRTQAEQILTSMFDSGDENLQATAVYGMLQFGNTQLIERVRPWLGDPDPKVQRQALFLITVAKDRASIPKVRPFVHHEDREMAIRAMRFLREMDAPIDE